MKQETVESLILRKLQARKNIYLSCLECREQFGSYTHMYVRVCVFVRVFVCVGGGIQKLSNHVKVTVETKT